MTWYVSKAEAVDNGYTHEAMVWGVKCWAKDVAVDSSGVGSFTALPKFLPLRAYTRMMNDLTRTILHTWVMLTGDLTVVIHCPVCVVKRIVPDKVEYL